MTTANVHTILKKSPMTISSFLAVVYGSALNLSPECDEYVKVKTKSEDITRLGHYTIFSCFLLQKYYLCGQGRKYNAFIDFRGQLFLMNDKPSIRCSSGRMSYLIDLCHWRIFCRIFNINSGRANSSGNK